MSKDVIWAAGCRPRLPWRALVQSWRTSITSVTESQIAAALRLSRRCGRVLSWAKGEASMSTAIVLYDLPSSIGLEECREHFYQNRAGFPESQGLCPQAVHLPQGRRCRRRRLYVGNASRRRSLL